MATDTELSSAVIDLRDTPATTISVPVRAIRAARVAAVLALVLLNIADLVTTRMFLNRGLEEGNGLSWVLIQNGTMPWVKSALLLALGWRALRAAPRLGTTCAMWFVVGLYTMTIVINCLALASV